MARVAVIGLGAVGVGAAWDLARGGHQVVGLEQFELDHDRGGSYGGSRIYRHVYPDAFYSRLMIQAWRLWERLEKEAGQALAVRCGGLFFAPGDHPDLLAADAALTEAGVPHEMLDPAECARRHPALRLLPGERALFQSQAGALRASLCVRAMAREARRLGAQLVERTEVLAIEAAPGGVRIVVAGAASISADAAVVACGPWASRFLPSAAGRALNVTRQRYAQFLPEAGCSAEFLPRSLPVWIDFATMMYGFPELGEPAGVKVARHIAGPTVDPDAPAGEENEGWLEELQQFAGLRFPRLARRAVYQKTCLYEWSPDEDFILDLLPGLPGVAAVAGTSGHGFKFAPLLGAAAGRLCLGQDPGIDLARLRLSRPCLAESS